MEFWGDLSIHNVPLGYLLLKHQVRAFEIFLSSVAIEFLKMSKWMTLNVKWVHGESLNVFHVLNMIKTRQKKIFRSAFDRIVLKYLYI